MKRIARSLLVLTLLVVAAQPTYACVVCNWDGWCVWQPEIDWKCKLRTNGDCVDSAFVCASAAPIEPLATEFRIASVEISYESDVKVAEVIKQNETEAPAAIAEAKVRN